MILLPGTHMRTTSFILLLLAAATVFAVGGCGKPPVEADAGDVPVIPAQQSEPPTPEEPVGVEPMPLEQAGEASDVAPDTLSEADRDDLWLTAPGPEQPRVDVATLRPVSGGASDPSMPDAPTLAEELTYEESSEPGSQTKLAPLPDPDVPPVSRHTTIAEIPRPDYESAPPPPPAQEASAPADGGEETSQDTASETETVASPAASRRLGWGRRPDPLAGAMPSEPDMTPVPAPETSAAPPAPPSEPAPAEPQGPAPQPLTSIITEVELEESLTVEEEPEDIGPAAEETPEVRRQVPPRPPEPEEMFVEKVVAGVTLQVNQQTVTVDEILAALHGELTEIPDHLSRERFRMEVQRIIARRLMSLIQQILVAEEAAELLEDPVKQQVEAEMEETLRDLVARAGGSMERLKSQIRQEGTTLDALLEAHRRSLLVRMYMQYKFIPAIVINRRMLWDYYRRHEDEYRSEKKVQMQILAVPFKAFLPEGTEDPTDAERQAAVQRARQRIELARQKLSEGEAFTDLVRLHSEGLRAEQDGIWPLMGQGNFAQQDVEAAAFELEEGQVSDIIETEEGYYLVKAYDVEPGKVVSFEEAQSQIRRDLQDEQLAELRGEHMRKLYENATVSRPDKFIELATDRAVDKYWR
jgi:peptidyl-prolyl cis-trans isomerase C